MDEFQRPIAVVTLIVIGQTADTMNHIFYTMDCLLTLCLGLILIPCVRTTSQTTEQPGFVYINTAKANLQTGNPSMPNTMNITVDSPSPGSSEELELRKSDIDINAPVFVICGDGLSICRENLADIKDFALYQDSQKKAAVSVTKNSDANGNPQVKVEGSILLNDVQYSIEDTDNTSSNSYTQYKLHKVSVEQAGRSDFKIVDEIPVDYSQINGRFKRQTSGYYGVELLPVIDYRIYEKWYKSSTLADPFLRAIDTKNRIRKYFAHVVNGMDLRYRAIQANDFQIYIKLVGYVIADRENMSPWTTDPQLGTEIDADTALEKFYSWRQGTQGLPAHDHATLFTGQDLYTWNGNEKLLSVTGYAYLGRVCNELSVSIVEDQGGFGCVKTATHELGHSLGANHDGDKNLCSTDDQYIMAGSSVPTGELNKLNPWQFSTCSVNAFRTKMQSLDRFGANCLINEAFTANDREWQAHLSKHPGQLFSVDDICMQVLGPSSYMCRDLLPKESDICTSLWCHINGTNQCRQYVPPRGTTCGSQKWCMEGVCTVDARAPIVQAKCAFGDQPGIAYQGATCATIVATKPRYCYESFIQQRCCKSCSEIYTSVPGCEYGNRQARCEPWWCSINDPDTPVVRKQCCGTCEVGVAVPKTPSVTLVPPVFTKDIGQGPTDNRPNVGCKNYIDSCELDIVINGPYLCYNGDFYGQCCSTCQDARQEIPGCEYGNREPAQCSDIGLDNFERLCSDPAFSSQCCRDCLSFQRRETQTASSGNTPTFQVTIMFSFIYVSLLLYLS